MASVVGICNLALAHFGQGAVVSSIDPPDGSIEAELCKQFFPIARDEMLEAHDWTWARKRVLLAETTNDREDFAYRYALPSDLLLPRRVLADGYDDTNDGADFQWEGASLYTDEADATLVYTYRPNLSVTAIFSPMFTTALTLRLASYICGPILKDSSGRVQANLYRRSELEISKAATSNANADKKRPVHTSTAARVR